MSLPSALSSSTCLLAIMLLVTSLARAGHWIEGGSEVQMVVSEPSEAAMLARDSWDMSFTFDYRLEAEDLERKVT